MKRSSTLHRPIQGSWTGTRGRLGKGLEPAVAALGLVLGSDTRRNNWPVYIGALLDSDDQGSTTLDWPLLRTGPRCLRNQALVLGSHPLLHKLRHLQPQC